MLNCEPQEIVITSNFLLDIASDKKVFYDFVGRHSRIWVHWQSVINKLKNCKLTNEYIRTIITAWETNILQEIPENKFIAELPAIVEFINQNFPDNAFCYCSTFGEYVNLRKNFGKEDIGGFIKVK